MSITLKIGYNKLIMIEISVVIPTYNRREILGKCLEYLFKQTYPKDKYEIVVIDDGSTDATEEMVKSLRPPCQLRLLHQEPGKKGPACANNLGIKNAKGAYILFINSDVYVKQDFIAEHMQSHHLYRSIIVQGPSINTTDFDNPFQQTKGYSGYSSIQMGYFITWNVSIKKELLFKAGLFDEDFRPYSWEDIEFGYRLKRLGIKQKFNKKALGYHYRPPFTLEELPGIKAKSKIMGKNGVLYYQKHPSLETKIAVGCWWGMYLFNAIRGFIAKKIIGTNRVLKLYKWLYDHKWEHTLAVLVGWAGKYWYMEEVREANNIVI